MSGQPTPVEGARSRAGRVVGPALSGTFVLIIVAALLVFVPLPYVVMRPGPVINTLGELDGKRIITVAGAPTYPTQGTLDFTTVRVVGGPGARVNVYTLLEGWLSSDQEVLPEEQIFPRNATKQQVQQENTAEMVNSQEVAAAVALRAVGKEVPVTVSVAAIPSGSPSQGVLQKGDVFVSVDGVPASDTYAIRGAIGKHAAGEEVTVVVKRGGRTVTVRPRTTSANGAIVIGVQLQVKHTLPVKVTIDAGSVGGPSAGTMFSLGVYDMLTPGPLTGGKDIAGTGTLNDAGQVGPIGGIRQKLAGARGRGAEWFLAPADNCREVVDHIPDGLRVVRIGTFDEARTAVQKIAAGQTAGLPSCS